MAENQEKMKPKEREIPVFTVLKNNCILKNIFVLDNPPPISSSLLRDGNVDQEPEMEEILWVGRHPDCNIKLEHPSISRFHLRIHTKPSSRSLSVTDLSSVHGTCVSGKRIEPGVKVELVQGDSLKLGESSRLYKLDWVPISFAYEINDSFIPQLDSSNPANEETEGTIDQDENSLPCENEWEQEMVKEALIPEDLHSAFPEKDEVENSGLPGMFNRGNEISSLCTSFTVDQETEGMKDQDGDGLLHRNNDEDLGWQLFEDIDLSLQEMNAKEASMPENSYHSSPEKDEVGNNLSPEMFNKENDISNIQLSLLNASITVDGEADGLTDQDGDSQSQIMKDLEWPDEDLAFSMQKMSATIPALPEDEVENIRLPEAFEKENDFSSSHLRNSAKETSPQVHISSTEYFEMNSEKRGVLNIWSRRGKSESVKIETSRSKANSERINLSSQVKPLLDEDCENKSVLKDQYASDEEIFTPDKENAFPNSCLVTSLGSKFDEALKSRSISNTTISCLNEDEEDFTSDKENMTPNGNLPRSFKNIRSSQGFRRSNFCKPSPLKTASHKMYREEVMLPPLDIQQGRVLQEITSTFFASKSQGRLRKQPYESKAENREPFLPLPVICTNDDKAASSPSIQTASINSSESEGVNQPHTSTIKATENNWTIVVDTACLLNKKSRRELQLLRGLRGTCLVVPRIVLRELDCMVRRASFLSRMTEASAALAWIEECMASTKWWIHVQSSGEENKLVPPTPTTASAHWFSEDRGTFSVGSIPFSPYTLQEIVTPTAADHILESALYFKKTMSGQFVLLSDDVTLKIKAMAEGVICETPKEFRATLVNPFSARFLYTDSSPRGPTWTCLDDTVLKERYYPSPSKKTVRSSGEGAKGLKLILLHNSNFRQLRA